jgi:NADP-dependent 3-hydroxy acid dehydrogenase YdfG
VEELTNHVALVTGASSGIGKAIALALAAQGTALCLVGRRREALDEVAKQARAITERVVTYQVDLTADDAILDLPAHLEHEVGAADLLIHGAGVIAQGFVQEAPVQQLDWQYRLNVRAPYLLTQTLIPMLGLRRGQIVFINSSAGLRASAGVSHYAATKHALRALADSLRDEVNHLGIRVISVFPGRTATPMQASIYNWEGKCYRPELLMQPEDVAATVMHALALPRTAEVTDIYIRPMLKP